MSIRIQVYKLPQYVHATSERKQSHNRFGDSGLVPLLLPANRFLPGNKIKEQGKFVLNLVSLTLYPTDYILFST